MAKTTDAENKPKRVTRRGKPGPKAGAKAAAAAAAANGNTSAATPTAAPARQNAATASSFKFELLSNVTISQSGERGQVRARAEWATGNVCYFVAYTTKAGEFKEAWIDADLLEAFKLRRRVTDKSAEQRVP